jgi:hypothetical protein
VLLNFDLDILVQILLNADLELDQPIMLAFKLFLGNL